MINEQNNSSNIHNICAAKEFKICVGKGCNNVGLHSLSIIYINKTGLFCETCKKELEKCGLVFLGKSIKNNHLEVTKSD